MRNQRIGAAPRGSAGAVAAFLLALLVVGPWAAEGLSAAAPTMRGVTAVQASGSAAATVVVPEDVSIALPMKGRNPDVMVRGGERLAAVALVSAGAGEEFSLISGVIRRCKEPGCDDRPTHFTVANRLRHGRVAIPAGTYRLFVISDGGNVGATVRLHGLTGHAEIPVDRARDVHVGTPTPHVSTGPAGSVYSAGETTEFAGGGIVFSALWIGGRPGIQTDLGTCIYRGSPPVPDALAYGPGCDELGAAGDRFGAVAVSTRFEVRLLSLSPVLSAGTWGHGLYYECACAATVHDALSVWLGR